VPSTWLRVGGGLLAFLVVALVSLLALRQVDPEVASEAWTLVTLLAIPAGIAAYALIEWLQTQRVHSLARQFDTRTFVLMPVAIALNIVLGTAVASALKVPIYLDSIGTILVAALAGPLAGAVTGLLSNLVWTYLAPPPFASPFAAPFALVAFVIGLMAGTFARWGWLRPRPGTSGRPLIVGAVVAIGLVLSVAVLALLGWRALGEETLLVPRADDTAFLVLGWAALVLVAITVVGLVMLLAWKRDLAAAYVVVAGVITGVVAAFIAAPIAASLFGGVTGSGTDFLVAAFRQAGADIGQAALGQSLISDPIDKVITYFVAYLMLAGLSVRTKAGFPQGDRLLP
jgi:energy-coupling factor transport system substrate-specific component